MVWRGKTPDIAMDDAEAMGYKIAILPVLLFNAVVGVCDQMLDELKQKQPPSDAAGGRRAERVFQADGRRGVGSDYRYWFLGP